MIKINATYSQQAGFGMPVSGGVAAVRTLLPIGGVPTAAAGTKRRNTDVAPVCTHIVDAVVLEDVFPGTSAWSPPI